MLASALRCLAAALLSLAPWAALAHTAGTIGFATIAIDGTHVRYELVLGLPSIPAPLAAELHLNEASGRAEYGRLQSLIAQKIAVSAEGTTCPAGPAAAPSRKGDNLVVPLRFECAAAPDGLILRDDLADLFGPDYHTLANITWPGGNSQYMFQPDRREARIVLASRTAQGAGSFLTLGIQHILFGFDHLLFLLALVLRGGNLWSLLKIVTAFTVAHSITLALAVFDVLVLPDRVVQAVIALSIAYVAAENLFMKRPVSHRWAVSFLFGLVHGIGFSGVLREMNLPAREVVWPLLSFNLGVEAGQATAVAVALPLLIWARRFKWEPRAVAAMSGIVLAVGVALFVERALL